MSEVLISFFVAQKLLLKWIISQVPIWKLEKSSASESASKRVSAGGPPFEARFAILSSSLKPLPLSKSPNKEREEPVSQVKWNLDALDAPLETKKWKVFRMTMFRSKTWRSLRQKCDRHRHRRQQRRRQQRRRQQRRRQRWTRSATFCHFRSNENNEFVLSTFFASNRNIETVCSDSFLAGNRSTGSMGPTTPGARMAKASAGRTRSTGPTRTSSSARSFCLTATTCLSTFP